MTSFYKSKPAKIQPLMMGLIPLLLLLLAAGSLVGGAPMTLTALFAVGALLGVQLWVVFDVVMVVIAKPPSE
jgi:hypothetical protein